MNEFFSSPDARASLESCVASFRPTACEARRDVRERRHWDDYQRAFDSMLSHTSTQWAPWYVVPADHRWFSHLATAGVLVTALNAINPRYPAADPAERDRMAQVRAELVAELGATQPG